MLKPWRGFDYRSEFFMFDQALLVKLANTTMPYGKYKGRLLTSLPQAYLVWFERKGFPANELGQLLQLALEIDHNGLKHLLIPLKHGTYST